MAISWTLTTISGCSGTQMASEFYPPNEEYVVVSLDGSVSCGGSCAVVQSGTAIANVHITYEQPIRASLAGAFGWGINTDRATFTITRGSSTYMSLNVANDGFKPPIQEQCGGSQSHYDEATITLVPGDYRFYLSFTAAPTGVYRDPDSFHDVILYIEVDATPESTSSLSGSESSLSGSESSTTSSSITESEESSSESELIYNGQTYYSEFKDANDINNPLVGKEVQMQFNGYWDASENGIVKTRNNQASIFCNDASKLFSLSSGYVGMTLSLPFAIAKGIYAPLKGDTSTLNEYILWGINVGQYESSQPTLYAALTPRGIEFTILTSEGRQTLLDDVSDIDANTDVFLEFVWNSSEIDNYLIRATLRVDEQETDSGNVPISNESISGLNFYVLNTSFYYSNMECTLANLSIWDRTPDNLIDIWWSSSSSSSSSSVSSSSSSSSNSSNSSLSNSSSSSSSFSSNSSSTSSSTELRSSSSGSLSSSSSTEVRSSSSSSSLDSSSSSL